MIHQCMCNICKEHFYELAGEELMNCPHCHIDLSTYQPTDNIRSFKINVNPKTMDITMTEWKKERNEQK